MGQHLEEDAKWKDFFYYFKFPMGVKFSSFWRLDKLVEGSCRDARIKGFNTLTILNIIETEMLEIFIHVGGVAPYR